MQILLTILMMVMIGAIIGGFTNAVAIKMLFRPYKTLYIGKWRVPFTPGLIPKRRDQLAEQMGNMVINHLLTPESIQRKLINDGFQKEMTNVVQKELANFLDTEKTPAELLEKLGINDGQEKIEQRLNTAIEEKYESLIGVYRNQSLKMIIPDKLVEKVDVKIPKISSFFVEKGVDYFSSFEGKMRIQQMADDFLKERSGMLGSMMQMLMGNINLADKIQPELIKFLQNEGTADIITTLLQKEWDKMLEWETDKLEEYFKKEDVLALIKDYASRVLKMERMFETPISELTASYRMQLSETLAINGVQIFRQWISTRMDDFMKRLHLQEIVQQQVESFPVERLEEMVLSITKSELKMITFLGALLGGMIGLFQGILAILIN